MPKVLHVVPAVAARYGGPSVATFGMGRALSAAGVDVLVATTDADGAGRLPVRCGEVTSHQGVPVIFFRRQMSEGFKYSRPLAQWVGAHAREFDLLHVHAVFSHASIAAARAARACGVPYIVRPLGTIGPWNIRRKGFRKRVLLAAGARQLLNGAAAIHYTSEDEQRQAVGGFPSLPPGVVIPLGLDDALTPRAASAASADAPYVLVVARLHEIKGIDLLIEAFSTATRGQDFAQWRLVVAGDGDPAYVAALRRIADRSGARVEFRGWTTGDARVALFAGASIFALPSRVESFGLAVAEAMACGVPVVVTPGVSLASDITAAGAGWVVERTTDALADGLRHAMTDAAERGRRGSRAATLAAAFRWPAVAQRLVTLYGDVCTRAAGRVFGTSAWTDAPVPSSTDLRASSR